MNSSNIYDWVIVGGGISGISIAEILSRNGLKIALIEKNNLLASETTKDFHEWFHTGSLYTLLNDKRLVIRYSLGAIDDLLNYYSSFSSMNLSPSNSGLKIEGVDKWFNNSKIHFKYKRRRLNLIWSFIVLKSISEIYHIGKHDWLRRRAGDTFNYSYKLFNKNFFINAKNYFFNSDKFFENESNDFTLNSQIILKDLVSNIMKKNGKIFTGSNYINHKRINGNLIEVNSSRGKINTKRIVICSPDIISKLNSVNLSINYAPIAIFKNLHPNKKSFVELDYIIKNCINLIVKNNGIGQAGGISMKRKQDAEKYLQYIIKKHSAELGNKNYIGSYFGIKKEITGKNNRNYLFNLENYDEDVWTASLGKFSMAFSMAPEFYRRVYNKNSIKIFDFDKISNIENLIDVNKWKEISQLNKL